MTIAPDAITVDFAGTSGLSHPRDQRAGGLYPRLHRASASRWWWRRTSRTTRPRWSRSAAHPGGLHPERAAALPGGGAPRDRASAAGPDDGLPAPGGAGPGGGGGCVLPVEPAVAGRRRGVRPGHGQPAGAAGFRGHHLQLAAAPARGRTLDGLDATAFPSGVRTMPVEATENVAPIVIWRKELRPAAGARGGRAAAGPGHGDRRPGRAGVRRATRSSIGSPIAPRAARAAGGRGRRG